MTLFLLIATASAISPVVVGIAHGASSNSVSGLLAGVCFGTIFGVMQFLGSHIAMKRLLRAIDDNLIGNVALACFYLFVVAASVICCITTRLIIEQAT